MTKFVIVLPIENYAREVDHKILLGAYLCKHFDATAVIANSGIAFQLALSLGSSCVFIGKNVFLNQASNSLNHENTFIDNSILMALLERRVKVLFSDEEGGLFLRGDNSEYDIFRMRVRTPLRDDQQLFSNQDFAMFHWGPYQKDLVQYNFPNALHFNAGAPFLDAAKIYRGLEGTALYSSFAKKVYELSLTSNSAILSNYAYNNKNLYLSLSSQIDTEPLWSEAIESEVRLAALANNLRSKGLKVCYRPHPSSTAQVARNWIKYCKSNDIGISYPVVESSLKYLLSSRVNVHPGCSTALQSFFLNLPTLKYASCGYGLHNTLVNERESSNAADLLRDLPNARVPILGKLASKLLASTSHSDISAFNSIKHYLKEYPSNPDIQTIDIKAIKTYLIRKNIHLKAKKVVRTILTPSTRFNSKFSKFHTADIKRNLDIANSIWTMTKVHVECGLPNSIILLPSR